MARTFQKEIACCEKAYSDNPESYTPRKREILAQVIAFLEGSNSIKRPAYARYICKNFRLSGKALAKKWNTSHPEDKKDEATFRTQVSVVSKELRKIFSYSPTEVFLNGTEDTSKLDYYENIMDKLEYQGKIHFDEMYISPVVSLARGMHSTRDYELSDCINEIALLRTLSISNIAKYINNAGVDADKLRYLRRVLDTDVLGTRDQGLREKKFELIRVLALTEPDAISDTEPSICMEEYLYNQKNMLISPREAFHEVGVISRKKAGEGYPDEKKDEDMVSRLTSVLLFMNRSVFGDFMKEITPDEAFEAIRRYKKITKEQEGDQL